MTGWSYVQIQLPKEFGLHVSVQVLPNPNTAFRLLANMAAYRLSRDWPRLLTCGELSGLLC